MSNLIESLWNLKENTFQSTMCLKMALQLLCARSSAGKVMTKFGSHMYLEQALNTLRPKQNGRHFTDDTFKCIFLNENKWISLELSLRFVSCDQQLYKWYFPSVCPSVRLSVTPFWLCSHHRIIMKFSRVITNDQRKVHAKGQGQRSKVKVTEVTTQLDRFRTVTPVWIHIWWWNDAYSLMLLGRGALLFFKVIRQISRSHGSKNRRILPRLGVSGL